MSSAPKRPVEHLAGLEIEHLADEDSLVMVAHDDRAMIGHGVASLALGTGC